MLMNYVFTLDSVFKSVPHKTWTNKQDLTNRYILVMHMFS